MIKVLIPAKFETEKRYIIGFFLDQYGVEYELDIHQEEDYHLISEKGILIFKDAFFSKYESVQDYLQSQSIPESSLTIEIDDFQFELIYGDQEFRKNESQVYCGLDIFASSFFMLTRWEEALDCEKDEHGRFPEELCLSLKSGFHKRPVVNEYLSFFAHLLGLIGVEATSQAKFQYRWTSDLEYEQKYDSTWSVAKSVIGSLVKRFSITEALQNLKEGRRTLADKSMDPYHQGLLKLDQWTKESNQKWHLYLIPSVLSEFDARYSYESALKKLEPLNAEIGIHPSYNSFLNEAQFQEELKRMNEASYAVEEGRQHFFRFKVPETWRTWNNAGLKLDSSLGFINIAGFRAGICTPYPVFDVLESKALDLIEIPTIIMDVALLKECPSKAEFIKEWEQLETQVREHKGLLNVLWHPNNVGHGPFRDLEAFIKMKITKS